MTDGANRAALAIATAAMLVLAAPALARTTGERHARLLGSLVASLAITQVVAGVVNVVLLAPVWMQLTHLLLADALWIALVLLGASVLARRPGPLA